MLRPIQPSSPATKELHGLWVAELEVISSLNSLPPESVLFFERRKMSSLDEKKNNEWTNSLTDWLARGQQLYSTYSVTRFGENSPLWQHFTNLWQLFEGLIRMWQTFEPTLENSVCFWANLLCWKWPNIDQTFSASGHTVPNVQCDNWYLPVPSLSLSE